MHVLIVGSGDAFCLESSYQRALESIGESVKRFDVYDQLQPFIPFGKVGQLLNTFLPVDTWQRKMNRKLSLQIQLLKPDLVLIFCNAPVLFSTLAFVKSIIKSRFILVWPDPLTNLQPHLQQAASLYDGVATYCRASVPVFEQLGFANVHWIPLAADPALHQLTAPATIFTHDLTFVGAFRPERGKTLAAIATKFPNLKLGIWGTSWQRCPHKILRPYIHNQPLRGKAYADLFNHTRINLNVIDHTCYPAANMRFFEIPIALGLQLSNSCPEMQEIYRHGEHSLYYYSDEELFTQVEQVLSNISYSQGIREGGYELTLLAHTYKHRASQLLDWYAS
jgi:hypothetical protein